MLRLCKQIQPASTLYFSIIMFKFFKLILVSGVLLIVVRSKAGEQSYYINNNETLKYSQLFFFSTGYTGRTPRHPTPHSTVTAVESVISMFVYVFVCFWFFAPRAACHLRTRTPSCLVGSCIFNL